MNADKRFEKMEAMLEQLLAACAYETQVPLSMRDAALASHVELRWLRERVERKEIPAYHNDVNDPWRVFPKDIKAFVMANTNAAPARRLRVLKRA